MAGSHPTTEYRLIIGLMAALLLIGSQPEATAGDAASPPAEIEEGVKALAIGREGIRTTIAFVRSRPALWRPARAGQPRLPGHEERAALRGAWSSLLDHLVLLDALRLDYSDYLSIQDEARKRATFAVSHGAFLAGYRYALEFIALAERNPDVATILNEPAPELGLAGGMYDRFKLRFLNVARATEFAALQVIAKALGNGEGSALRAASKEDAAAIWRMGRGKGQLLTLQNAVVIAAKAGAAAWFPVQKGAAEWMGATRVRRSGTALVSAEQVRDMRTRLQPGDILLERREWYLSNLGLPGFWTHAALYVGTPDERRAFFADPEVRDWVREQGEPDGDFERLLGARFPDAYRRSLASQDGHPPRILEAISPGVSFTSLEHTAAADSIAVLRARLPKREKAVAVWRGFQYSGRPYDFNFDFLTDSALVCSELVYKVYEPATGRLGLRFPLEEILGRRMVTPNGMARWFDQEYPEAARPVDLVLFLDGYERGGTAVEASVEAFRQSWRRPKWHVLVQDVPEEAGARRGL